MSVVLGVAGAHRAATRRAMRALLVLGEVEAEERETRLGHGVLLHLECGTGEPLVLIQGAGGGAGNWYRLLGPLAAWRRVYAPELPGFGVSDPIETKPPLGAQAAGVLLDWLEACVPPGPVDLVATSFGGLVALRMALAAPERIRRIVLLNSTGLGRGLAFPVRFAGLRGIRRVVAHPTRAGTARLFRTLLTSDRSQLPTEHIEALTDYTWCSALGGAGEGLANALGSFAGLRGQREVITPGELARVRAPVRIVWGEADRFLPPRHGPRAAARLPAGSCRLLPRIGHSPNWEAPAAVLEELRGFFELA